MKRLNCFFCREIEHCFDLPSVNYAEWECLVEQAEPDDAQLPLSVG